MDRLDGRSDRGSRKRGMSLILGAAVLTTQIWGMGASPVLGSEEEAESETTVLMDSESGTYEGTTQFLTTDLYLDFDMSSVSLVVEEVYAQAGSVLSQGDRLLKLTEESYREALDYYEAAVIYAENALTDEELAYDQGTAEAEYALEMARALADQAEYVKTSNEAELEDTLEEHQEVMTELEEAMSEIEEGIADGSYGESSSSSSDDGAFGGSGSAGGTGGGSGQGTGTSQGESEKTEDQAQESMGQTEMSQEENGSRPQDDREQTENGMNQENGENFPESESQQENGGGQQISESQEESGEGQPESDRLVEEEEGSGEADSGEQAQTLAEELSELVTQRETLAARLAILNQEYNDFLSELYERSELSTENFCGTGTVLTGGTVDGGAQTETEEASRETPQTSPVAGLEGVETVKTSSSQEELPNETAVPETAAEAQTRAAAEAQTQAVTEAQTQAATEAQTQAATEAQTQAATEAQIQAATEAQTQAATEAQTQAAEETQAAGGNADQGSSASNTDDILIEEETGQEVVSNSGQTLQKTAETDGTNTETDAQQSEEQTEETGEDAEIETETETLTDEEKLARLESLLVSMNELEEERAELYSQISRLDDQIFDRRTQYLELLEGQLEEAESEVEKLTQETDETRPADQEAGAGTTGQILEEENPESESASGQPEGTTGTAEMAESQREQENEEQNRSGSAAGGQGMSGDGTGAMSGMSQAGGGTELSGASGLESGDTAGNLQQGTGSAGGETSAGSLFGDEYDLTEIKNLLERTPASEEEAEELLEQLQEGMETVESQYAELVRNEKATRLEIQYTYDTAVLEGELAEITYQQTMEGLERTLQEARDQVDSAQEELEELESWEDGVIASSQSGLVASVSWEAGDQLSASLPLVTFYETGTVYVDIQVSQYQVADISVGDAATVTLSGYGTVQGTVEEKSPEAADGGSRTEVNYEVRIALDNESGRLTSGLSAEVQMGTSAFWTEGRGMLTAGRRSGQETERNGEEETENE